MFKNLIIVLALTLMVGCFSEAPLVNEKTIPINKELLGIWVAVNGDSLSVSELDANSYSLVLNFSHISGREGLINFEAYEIKANTTNTVQVKIKKDTYVVCRYVLIKGSLRVYYLDLEYLAYNTYTKID